MVSEKANQIGESPTLKVSGNLNQNILSFHFIHLPFLFALFEIRLESAKINYVCVFYFNGGD